MSENYVPDYRNPNLTIRDGVIVPVDEPEAWTVLKGIFTADGTMIEAESGDGVPFVRDVNGNIVKV